MGSGSAGIRRIPEDQRCEIAGQLTTFLSVIYDLAFREVTDDFEQREREIWIEVGKEVPQLAGTCRLRSSDAPGIADTISVVRELLFGSEFKSEVLDLSPDTAVILTKRCPFLTRAQEMGGVPEHCFPRCLAFSVTATERLNPKYTLRFVRAMCMGDRNCECKIVLKNTVAEE